jgi:DnaK suppressor protein
LRCCAGTHRVPDTLSLMDLEHFRRVLLAKEQELNEEIARLAEEGRTSRTAEVEDPIDEVTSDEAGAIAFGETSNLSDTLTLVREALRRMDRGEYGRCIDCGRQIEIARLEAVPWTPYCLDDQRKHDAQAAE